MISWPTWTDLAPLHRRCQGTQTRVTLSGKPTGPITERVLRGFLFFAAFDESRRDNERATTRDDQAVAGELVERARDRFTAAADHVRELLLGRAATHDETIGSRRAFFTS